MSHFPYSPMTGARYSELLASTLTAGAYRDQNPRALRRQADMNADPKGLLIVAPGEEARAAA